MRFVNLARLRRTRGLTVDELSGKSKLSSSTIRKAETGVSVREATAFNIVRALGLDMETALKKMHLRDDCL